MHPFGNHTDAAPIARFEDCLGRLFDLCAALEAFADALPLRVDTRAAALLTARTCTTLRRCHRGEEAAILPVLQISDPTMGPIFDRLRAEHLEDRDNACDLRDAVAEFDPRARTRQGDEIGYMVRGLSMSLRRHVAFDRDVILPLWHRVAR